MADGGNLSPVVLSFFPIPILIPPFSLFVVPHHTDVFLYLTCVFSSLRPPLDQSSRPPPLIFPTNITSPQKPRSCGVMLISPSECGILPPSPGCSPVFPPSPSPLLLVGEFSPCIEQAFLCFDKSSMREPTRASASGLFVTFCPPGFVLILKECSGGGDLLFFPP